MRAVVGMLSLMGVLGLQGESWAQGLGTNEAGDLFAGAVAVGDFDGDGWGDVAVGATGEAPGSDPRSGVVFVFRGTPGGIQPWQVLDQAGLGSNEADDQFGTALAAGDFNGDGLDDLAVGAPGEAPGADPSGAGFVFVFRGTRGGLVAAQGLDQAGRGPYERYDRGGGARARRGGATFCPSEAARAVAEDWLPLIDDVRRVAAGLPLRATQGGREVDIREARGPVRLSLR